MTRLRASGSRNNPGMRLVHRGREPDTTLDEADCYAHSYGEHVLDHVDPVRQAPPVAVPEIPWDLETPRHVTTEGLKRQFEERLASRGRRRPRRRGSRDGR
jgi:hypothetical protein